MQGCYDLNSIKSQPYAVYFDYWTIWSIKIKNLCGTLSQKIGILGNIMTGIRRENSNNYIQAQEGEFEILRKLRTTVAPLPHLSNGRAQEQLTVFS